MRTSVRRRECSSESASFLRRLPTHCADTAVGARVQRGQARSNAGGRHGCARCSLFRPFALFLRRPIRRSCSGGAVAMMWWQRLFKPLISVRGMQLGFIAIALLIVLIWQTSRILCTSHPANGNAHVRGDDGKSPIAPVTLAGRRQDCGLKSLYLVCRAAGISRGIVELRQMIGGSGHGASMLDMKNAAVALGFSVSAERTSFEHLRQHLNQPGSYAILHCDTGHFVAALSADHKCIRLIDPSIGIDDVHEESLFSSRYRWGGVALLISSPAQKERPDSQ